MCIAYADIYKWIDDQGVVNFSDTPHPGAEKVELPEAQTFSPPTPGSPASERLSPEPNSQAKGHMYTKVVITQPDNEATIRNNQGFIAITVQVEPDLFPGDKLQLIFDGTPLGEPQNNTSFQLNGVNRGSHTLAVQIVDAGGEVIDTSDSITIFMFRPRVGMVAPAK